ncbi:MAG: hypothetical protein QXT45_03510 [Candidatus Bilamarchaeaceae archaeon]
MLKLIYGSMDWWNANLDSQTQEVVPVVPTSEFTSHGDFFTEFEREFPGAVKAVRDKLGAGISLRKAVSAFTARADFVVVRDKSGTERRLIGVVGSKFGTWNDEEVNHAAHTLKWFALKNNVLAFSTPAFGTVIGSSISMSQASKIFGLAFGENKHFTALVYMGQYKVEPLGRSIW